MNIASILRSGASLSAVALALAASCGCAITDYSLITDNDQGPGPVNTNGKATCGKFLVATEWPDGIDRLISFVDQTASGDRTLTTYNDFTPLGTDPFFDYPRYCTPEWTGCAIFTAPDPEVGDVDRFDGTFNPNCSGARSLSLLVATSRYYGECGRSRVRLPFEQRLALLNHGAVATRRGHSALRLDLTPSTLRIALDNNTGDVSLLPLAGDASVYVYPGRRPLGLELDATNPILVNNGLAYAKWLGAKGTHVTTVTATYLGASASIDIGGNTGPSTPERVRSYVLSHH